MHDPTAEAENVAAAGRALRNEVHRRVVGQAEAVEHLLVTLFAGGHAIFVGVPGLAKTLLIRTLATATGASFRRIQFTPDLMPADITGSELLDTEGGRSRFRFVPGPLFANVVLADEINRTPAKTQAALLESMQERAVSQGNQTYPLPRPFHVFATQNPIEQEGTYPLPEAQLDRFAMMLRLTYPSADEEARIARGVGDDATQPLQGVLGCDRLAALQAVVPHVPVAESLVRRAVAAVRATRPGGDNVHAAVRDFVAFGAGPRATQAWVRLAQARALLHGRLAAEDEDFAALTLPVLRHRVLRNFEAEAQNVDVDALLSELLRRHFG